MSKKSIEEYHLHHSKKELPKVEIDKEIVPQVFEYQDDSWDEFCAEPYKIHGGRSMNFLVVDRGQRIGAILLKNDTPNLKPRDKFIGWGDVERIEYRLQFTVRATLVTPEPKLLPLFAWLAVSKQVQVPWNAKFPNQHIVGVTTTSLQQDELKYWDYCGEYTTKTKVEPSPLVMDKAVEWMKSKHPKVFKSEIYNLLGVTQPTIETVRKVHFCELYKDTLPFLRYDKKEILAVPAFDSRMRSLVEEWKNT